MSSLLRPIALIISALAFLAQCAAFAANAPPAFAQNEGAPGFVNSGSAADVRARFVVLGPEGVATARVITGADVCPALTLDGAPVPMALRAGKETIPQRPTMSRPEDSKSADFPIITCDLAIPEGTFSARLIFRDGDFALPLPVKNPQRILIIGDTGCRLKLSEGLFQPCNSSALWPFEAIADMAAHMRPDLVIHTGDIHYRENACPKGLAVCKDSPWGYGFDAIEADFFAPARHLLEAAPWIFVRGNHEICARAGQGWWRFFDPRPLVPHQNCNDPADDDTGDYSAPYAVPIGDDTRLIVFDSAKVGIKILHEDDAQYKTYKAQMEEAFGLIKDTPHAFFIDHHPILGLATNAKPDGSLAAYAGNQGLQSVLNAITPKLLFPRTVQGLISGHIHVFQVTSFASDHPPQFISGNAGTWVDDPNLGALPAGAKASDDSLIDHFVTSNAYGFLTMQRVAQEGASQEPASHDPASDHWLMREWTRFGTLATRCDLINRKASCTPAILPNPGRG